MHIQELEAGFFRNSVKGSASGIRFSFPHRMFWSFLTISLAYFGAGYFFSGELIAFHTRSLAEDRLSSGISDPSQFGIRNPTDVTIPIRDGHLAGWIFESSSKRECGVVFLHGHGGTMNSMLKYAPLFTKRGCTLLFFNQRHHAGSTGGFGTYGYYEKFDLQEVITWFAREHKLPTHRIGVLGESYGASVALQTAGLGLDIAFIAADSPFRDMRTIVDEHAVAMYGKPILLLSPMAFAIAAVRAKFDPADSSPIRAARSIRVPVFIVHADNDQFIAPYHAHQIF